MIFGLREIETITGVPLTRISQWRARRVFTPSDPRARGNYTMRDVLQVAALGLLCDIGIGAAHASASLPPNFLPVAEALGEGMGPNIKALMRGMRLVVWNERTSKGVSLYSECFEDLAKAWERIKATQQAAPGQAVFVFPLGAAIVETMDRAKALWEGQRLPPAVAAVARGWAAFDVKSAPTNGA